MSNCSLTRLVHGGRGLKCALFTFLVSVEGRLGTDRHGGQIIDYGLTDMGRVVRLSKLFRKQVTPYCFLDVLKENIL